MPVPQRVKLKPHSTKTLFLELYSRKTQGFFFRGFGTNNNHNNNWVMSQWLNRKKKQYRNNNIINDETDKYLIWWWNEMLAIDFMKGQESGKVTVKKGKFTIHTYTRDKTHGFKNSFPFLFHLVDWVVPPI